LQILSHPWITKGLKMQNRVKIDLESFAPGLCISHPDYGEGIIVRQEGLVCEVSFAVGTKFLILTEFSGKSLPINPENIEKDEEKEFEQKLSKNYPASYKSTGSKGRPPRPNKISVASNSSQKFSFKSDNSAGSGGNSPIFNFEKRGGSNHVELGMKNSFGSCSSGFGSGSEGTETVCVNPSVMAQRVKELERLQKQLEGPSKTKSEKVKSEKGLFSKIGGIFGFG
jgi:hypothetical protein